MKIAFINDTYGTGSIGRLSKELSEECVKAGNTVHFYYVQGSGNTEYCKKICDRKDQKLHAVMSRITGLQGYFSKRKTSELVASLKDFAPDVVHLQNLHSNYINLKEITDYLANHQIATVLTLHDCWYYTGKCTHYVPVDCRKWMEGCGKCPLLHFDNVNPTFFFDTTHKCLSDKEKWFGRIQNLAVVGVSDWISGEAKQSIYKAKKIQRIYNWVDETKFYFHDTDLKKRLGLEDKKIALMVASALSEKKGYQELKLLAAQLPESWKLIFIGRVGPKYEIPSNVMHIENTNNADRLAEFYSIADVCVNATQYETFGMVTAEAMSCGTPVVIYNNTASPELMADHCGIILQSIEELLDAVKEIAKWDRGETREMCIKHARELFDKSRNTAQYLVLYQSMVKGNE